MVTNTGRGKPALGISFSHKRAEFRRFEKIWPRMRENVELS
jgi:hypothetical protein